MRWLSALLLLAACQPSWAGRLAALADSTRAGRHLTCGRTDWVIAHAPIAPYSGAQQPLQSCVDTARDTFLLISVDAAGQVLEVTRGVPVRDSAATQQFDALAATFSSLYGAPVRCRPVEHPDVTRELYWSADSQFVRVEYDGRRYLWWEHSLGAASCQSGPADSTQAGA
jgi:hypothetical protein